MSQSFKDEKLNNYAIKAIRLMSKGMEPYEVCGVLGIKFNTLVLAMKRFGDEEVNIHLQHIINKNKKRRPELKAPPSSPLPEPEPIPEPEIIEPIPEPEPEPIPEPVVITFPERDLNFKYRVVQHKLSNIDINDIATILKIEIDEVVHILNGFNMNI